MAAQLVDNELPPLYKRHIRRPRLTRLLDASNAQAILIIGPAGYGKTTLAAEWLQGRDAGYWYRATGASADVAAFSAGVVEIIQPLLPGAGDRVLQRLRVPEVPERLARILAELLAEDIQEWPKDKWLVVDDYHLVAESTAVEEFVDWLLTLSPLRLITTSRVRPSWASARRTLYGEVTEIARRQLAMTPEEAGRIVRGTLTDSVHELVDEAQGWPALIGLAASGASMHRGTRLAESLHHYMTEELFRREDEDAQAVLLRSAVPPELDEHYAAALDIDLRASRDLFERQALVDKSDASSVTLHPLLREFLREEFKALDPSSFADCHRVAFRVALENERWHDAFELAQTVDHMLLAEVVVRAAPSYFTQGRLETIEKWLNDVPDSPGASPFLLLIRADMSIRLERLLAGHALAAEVADQVGDEHPAAMKAWSLQGQASYWQANDARALAEQRRAIRVTGGDEDRRQALWYAYLASSSLERDDAHEFLDALDELNRTLPSAPDRLRIAVGRVVLRSRQGTLAGGAETLERATALLGHAGDPLIVSSFLAHSAWVYLSRAKYDRARDLAREASRQARTLRLTLPIHASLAYEALAELGVGNHRAARRIQAELRESASKTEDPNPALITAIVGIRIALARREDLQDHLEPPVHALLAQASAIRELEALIALAAVVLGADDLAETKLKTLAATKGLEPFMYSLLARLILADRRKDAGILDLLATAVREVNRRACHDALVLAYRAHPELLRHVPGLPEELRAVVQRVLVSSRDHKLAASYGLRLEGSDPIDSLLTLRELEVLRLMAEGLRNAEIAQALVIAHSTAKVHVHNVMHKLGATSRLQAIRRYEAAELAGTNKR